MLIKIFFVIDCRIHCIVTVSLPSFLSSSLSLSFSFFLSHSPSPSFSLCEIVHFSENQDLVSCKDWDVMNKYIQCRFYCSLHVVLFKGTLWENTNSSNSGFVLVELKDLVNFFPPLNLNTFSRLFSTNRFMFTAHIDL